MIDATNILQTLTLGGVAWIFARLVKHGEKLARIEQKLKDLPCGEESCKSK